MPAHNPTQKTYQGLDLAYEWFNRELFHGDLPYCLITMQRHKGAYGYFSGGRFADARDSKIATDEIALNPQHFAERSTEKILSTLAHEMCHLWQHHHGKQTRPGYHDKEWAAKMHEIGLIPTSTGQLGGKMTGQAVTHVIDPQGRFAASCQKLLAQHNIVLYQDTAMESAESTAKRAKKNASKTKYTCPGCGNNVWGKPGLMLICGEDRVLFESAEETEE